MALKKVHKAAIDSALPALYDQGVKIKFGQIKPGTVVVTRFLEELGDESFVEFQALIVFAQNRNESKCADLPTLYGHVSQETGILVPHDQECVVLIATQLVGGLS